MKYFYIILAILIIAVVGCSKPVEETPVVIEEPVIMESEEFIVEEPVEIVPKNKEVLVVINGKTFDPEVLTINIGDTVAWKKTDGRAHKIMSNDELFYSGEILLEDDVFRFTFNEAGTYEYRDLIFGAAQGKIIVE